MMLQLAATIALLLGGIYALFCLSRAAAGLDRMATALEEWVAMQQRTGQQSTQPPRAGLLPDPQNAISFEQRVNPAAPSTPVAPVAPVTPAPSPAEPPAQYPRPS